MATTPPTTEASALRGTTSPERWPNKHLRLRQALLYMGEQGHTVADIGHCDQGPVHGRHDTFESSAQYRI